MSVMGRPPKSPNYTEREQRLKQEAEVAKAGHHDPLEGGGARAVDRAAGGVRRLFPYLLLGLPLCAVVVLLCAMLAPTRHCIPSFDLSHPDHRETLDGSVPDLRRPPDLRSPPDLPPPCTGTCAPCTRPEELLPAPMVSLDKRSVRLGSSKAEVKWALNRCQELAAAGLHRKCQRFEFEINPHRPSKAVAAFELDKTEIKIGRAHV